LFCPSQITTGVNIAGSHAEYMVAYANATQLLPNGLSYEQAAPIFCAGYTVYSGLRFADPKPHERVAVVGIGALGHLGIQYSKAAGFETIAVTHSKDKEELAYKLGADSVVADGKGLLEDKGGGADVILATSNSYKAIAGSIKGLRPDGRLILMGASATNEPFILSPELSLDFLFKRHRLIASLQNDREYLYEALDYVAKGKVKVMTEIFPLEEISNAYDKVADGNVRFKAVIDPIK
jgi:dehydrogenase